MTWFSPQSQSFSRSYGSNLPNSLTYFLLVDQRLLTLETWCGCWYEQAGISRPPIFKGRHGNIHSPRGTALPDIRPYLWIIQFHGLSQLRRKDNSSGATHRRLGVCLCCHTASPSCLRNMNLIPFRPRSWALLRRRFRRALGSSHPWPIAVLMEPFSTSAFKVSIWIIATNTKIGTRHSSTQAFAPASPLCPRPLTHWSFAWNNGRVSVLRYSAIHFKGRFIQQVSKSTS